jgi:hypothetical protein
VRARVEIDEMPKRFNKSQTMLMNQFRRAARFENIHKEVCRRAHRALF